MKKNSTISKILSTSPDIVLKKGRDRFVRKYKKHRERIFDTSNQTYTSDIPGIDNIIGGYFNMPDSETLNFFRNEIIEFSDRILKHEFDLLGSGPVKVFHGLEALGFDHIKYKPGHKYSERQSFLKNNITYGQHFIHNQDLWF